MMSRAQRRLDEFRRDLSETPMDEIDGRDLELRIREVANGVGRALMYEVFERVDAESEEVKINGETWGHRRESAGTYTTLFGDVEIKRGTYSRQGRGRVAVPLDLRLGIVEKRYTPQVARVLNRAIALMTPQEAEGFLREAGVAEVSASTLHRVPRAIAARFETMREQLIEEIRKEDTIPDDAVTVQVGLDGVMVPQDGEHAKPRGRPSAEPAPPRHEIRYGVLNLLGPAANDGVDGRAWHEATVGTVAFYDAEGENLRTIYLAQMPESGKATIASELEKELTDVLTERPELDVCFASDGAEQHWSLFEGMHNRLPPQAYGTVTFLTDFFHVMKYVKLAANANVGVGTPEAKVLATNWRETLKTYDDGAHRVLKSMRYHRDKHQGTTVRKEMDTAINYIAKQTRQGRTDYAQAILHNRPIGTGVTEAAAKTVVGVRMKRAGARFSQHGGQTIMLFRTAILSERFDRLSQVLEDTYTANVIAA